MRQKLLSVTLALAAATAGFAQEPGFSSAATQACLYQEGEDGAPRKCIGLSAELCISAPAGSTTVGMGYCFDRELKFWDQRLNASYKKLRSAARAMDAEMKEIGASAPSQANTLRDMQRAWIVWRDAACDYERSLWGGGTGGGPATLSCLMYRTAEQALFLEAQEGIN